MDQHLLKRYWDRWFLAGGSPHDILQHCHHVLGIAAAADTDRQTEADVLVDHVEEL